MNQKAEERSLEPGVSRPAGGVTAHFKRVGARYPAVVESLRTPSKDVPGENNPASGPLPHAENTRAELQRNQSG